MSRPTRDEVARLAKVSTATVSRVLDNRGGAPVSDKLRARVLAIAEEIGYRPNGAARALASGRTHIVAFVAPDCFTPFYSLVGRYISQQGFKRQYQVIVNSMLHYLEQNGPGGRNSVSPFLSWHVDGILCCDLHPYEDHTPFLYRTDTPLVGLGVFHEPTHDFVGVDLYTGAVQAIQHLLAPGCRRVAYMFNAEATRARDPRTRAYQDVMQEAGLEPETISLPDQQRSGAHKAIVDHVRQHGLPEAIFCINDDVAIGCYRGLRDLGVRLPDDVALVGCDGLQELEYLDTPISTIAHPIKAMCEQGWDFLERRIHELSIPVQQTILTSQLVVRASSDRYKCDIA